MLMKTDVISRGATSPQEATRCVSGQYVARNRLDARGRARLAANIVDERVTVRNLTVRQAARLCRVSVPLIADARRPPAKPETLAEHFAHSTPAERLECARIIGPAIIWDQMIAPLV